MTRLYDTQNWKDIAARQLARQPLCEGCPGVVTASLADHIVPIKAGGAMRDPNNLQSLCRACHAQKTSAERYGRMWVPTKQRGCNLDGSPHNQSHPHPQQPTKSKEDVR